MTSPTLLSTLGYLELSRFCLILCSCSRRVFSSLTGLGMKPTSQPSFTSRPIHQSLLYFYGRQHAMLDAKAPSNNCLNHKHFCLCLLALVHTRTHTHTHTHTQWRKKWVCTICGA